MVREAVVKAGRSIAGMGRAKKTGLCILLCLFVAYLFCLPPKIFEKPYATVLTASNGQLLSASIARDGQWRFPRHDSVPEKFIEALLTFEDKRFYYHPGVDPLSMGRALVENVRKGKIVSGGSTISMQVIRLSRMPRQRSIFEKLIEIILATRLELRYSKSEILALYAAHAPFGGNVVGIEAACWRYFGRLAEDLSWAEAALLAVLPNAPSLIHPGQNRELLKLKRDKLLDRLFDNGKIDAMTCTLGKQEPIPDKPQPLPRLARHVLGRMKAEGLEGQNLLSAIDHNLQQRVEAALQQHHERLKANQIFNGAVLVLDVRTGKTLAYAGNVKMEEADRGQDVDIITSPRSTGSILKPFLYAAALDDGLILPKSLLPDIPVFMNGFAPENFSKEYDGVVPASDALIRSLNVPAVFLLKEYRYERFYTLLKQIGLTTLRQPADHYGLSLVLGGAEGTLWDITGSYASMARTLNNYFQYAGSDRYTRGDFHAPVLLEEKFVSDGEDRRPDSWLSASAIHLTFEALRELYRPEEESGWKFFSTSKRIAWKTGTSFGFRDGWAVGVTADHAVGVWVGNADGEGRAGLTGTAAAAPLMFDIFSLLPSSRWFDQPRSEMSQIVACEKSGRSVSIHCERTDTVWVPKAGLESPACSYHKTIHLSEDERFRLNSACADVNALITKKWFVLPPVQEYYFKSKNISYKPLPPIRQDCQDAGGIQAMGLVYPKPNARLFIPRDFDGKPGSSIFQLAHHDASAAVFWHLDGRFIGSTRGRHHMALNPGEGEHILSLVDENGHSLEERFTVISGL